MSAQPSWALLEFALLVVCCAIASAFAVERRLQGDSFDKTMIIFIVLLCLMKCTGFLVSTAAAFSSGAQTLDTDLLLDSFSNKRFYGQFQTLTLPLLAIPLLLTGVKRSAKALVFGMLACWWMIAVCGGTRGTWLGMAVAAVALALCGRHGRRSIAWQALGLASGILLFWLLFSVLPDYLGIEIANFASDRLTASLSGREIIWHQAWDMIRQRPLLGVGPMHFANTYNPVAAHPHQAILQWASEWGIPSALLVGGLVLRGLFATLRLIRRNGLSSNPVDLIRICLFASLIGALTQSMVDGVIVMPYSQLWLAIVTGWLIGIHEHANVPRRLTFGAEGAWLILLVAAVMFMAYAVARDAPHLEEREDQFALDFGGRFQPRFWMQGIIAKPGPSLLEPPEAARFSTQSPK
jgi:O-antigen ligase